MKETTAKYFIMAGALSLTSVVHAGHFRQDMHPYVGLDYKQTEVKNKNNWYHNFTKSFPGASVYAGSRFHKHWGVELGYDWARKKSHAGTHASPEDFRSHLSFRGARLDVNAYWPMKEHVEWIGVLGLVAMKTRVAFDNQALDTANARLFSQMSAGTKTMGRLGLGLQYMGADQMGVRGLLRWENTSRIRLRGKALSEGQQRPFKDSISLNLGLFYKC